MKVKISTRNFILDLPPRFCGNTLYPNPEYLNTIYKILDMPQHVAVGELVLPGQVNVIFERLGSPIRVVVGDDIEMSYDVMEHSLKNWLEPHGT